MIEKIKSVLSKKKLWGWQIRELNLQSHQSFLALNERECRRHVSTQEYHVTVFQSRQEEGKDVLGKASFVVIPNGEMGLEQQLEHAIFSAGLVKNQTFDLPRPAQNYPSVEISDPHLEAASLQRCEDRIKAAVAKEKGTRLSTTEFFINRSQTRLVNHQGLDISQESTKVQTEFILLSQFGKRENEFINRYSRRYENDFDIEKEIAASAQFARAATESHLPDTGTFPVLFSGEPLDGLFDPLVAAASARMKYNKMVQNQLGDELIKNAKGDKITLFTHAALKGGMNSYLFDSFGSPATRTVLIEDNILKNYGANKQFADYLEIPVTGDIANIEVLPGQTPWVKFPSIGLESSPKMYHIQAFSAFEPNDITGAFSAEIRAGQEITPQGIKPIKGGSVSGVLPEALQDCLLSKETTRREAVFCPRGILFKKLTIAGK